MAKTPADPKRPKFKPGDIIRLCRTNAHRPAGEPCVVHRIRANPDCASGYQIYTTYLNSPPRSVSTPRDAYWFNEYLLQELLRLARQLLDDRIDRGVTDTNLNQLDTFLTCAEKMINPE